MIERNEDEAKEEQTRNEVITAINKGPSVREVIQ